MPDGFFQSVLMEEQGVKLPPLGSYAVGQFFLPRAEPARNRVKDIVEVVASQLGHVTLTWRPVPTNNRSLGKSALQTEPVIEQWFITARGNHAALETEQQVKCSYWPLCMRQQVQADGDLLKRGHPHAHPRLHFDQPRVTARPCAQPTDLPALPSPQTPRCSFYAS